MDVLVQPSRVNTGVGERVRLRTGVWWMERRERHWETLLVALVLTLCVRMEQCDVYSGEGMRVREVRHFRK